MRVGLIARNPWVLPSGGSPEGVEVELVRELAEEVGAEVTWLTSSEADVLDALKRHELDLVVGGLTSGNPWATHVAFTRPFYRERLVVAAPEPQPLDDLDGIAVAITRGSAAADLVAEHEGIPVPEDGATEYEAKPEWQLEAVQHAVFVLHTDEHVFAVPHGENAWLIAVDRFLRDKEDAVRAALEARG